MVETDIHDKADAAHHAFCKEVVLRFARICHVIHENHFKTKSGPARSPPAQAIILYGQVSSHPREGFDKPNAASLSTSLPSAGHILQSKQGNLVVGNTIVMRHGVEREAFDLKKDAAAHRARRLYKKLAVSAGITPEAMEAEVRAEFQRLAAISNQDKTVNGPNPPGNCAEWTSWAA